MKISQIIQETTTSGSVAPVELGFVKMQTRNPSVYGGNKVGNLLKGKKTSKPFANSVNESKMKDLAYDMEVMKPAEFQKKYGKTREQMKASPINKPAQPQKPTPPVNEADLSEQDLILVPGQGHKLKTGFVPHDKDRTDHEVEMAVSDLFSAGKNAEKIYNIVRSISEEEGLEGWVQEKIIKANDYLNTVREYLEGKQLKTEMMPAGVITNGNMGESLQRGDTLVTDALKLMRGSEVRDAVTALTTVLGNREYNSRRGFYNFYIKQMIDMYNKQGVSEGSEDYQEIFQMNTKQGKVGAVVQYKDKSFGFIYGTKLSPTKFARAREAEQALNAYHNKQGVAEGAKVDRMVKHIAKSEKKLGHSKKEAENIAWATANKRGMLDNKNKKA